MPACYPQALALQSSLGSRIAARLDARGTQSQRPRAGRFVTTRADARVPASKALEALERIKGEYRRFYDESMEQTRSFENGMSELLSNIMDDILHRLNLSREDEPDVSTCAACAVKQQDLKCFAL